MALFKCHPAWTPFTSNSCDIHMFCFVFYLTLGSIPVHISHWFVFNERHWFALIKSSLITMNQSQWVFTMVSQVESRHSWLHTFLTYCSTQMNKEYLNTPCGIFFIIHSWYVFCSLNRALKKNVQLCALACIQYEQSCRVGSMPYFKKYVASGMQCCCKPFTPSFWSRLRGCSSMYTKLYVSYFAYSSSWKIVQASAPRI